MLNFPLLYSQNAKKELRKTIAAQLFLQSHPEIADAFLVDGLMSDVEPEDFEIDTQVDGVTQTTTQQMIPSIAWRSQSLSTLFHLLDEAYVQSATTPRATRDRRTKIKNLTPSTNVATAPGYGFIPANIPRNWVTSESLSTLSEVQIAARNFQADVPLDQAIQTLRRSLKFNPGLLESTQATHQPHLH